MLDCSVETHNAKDASLALGPETAKVCHVALFTSGFLCHCRMRCTHVVLVEGLQPALAARFVTTVRCVA